ncbi:MAG TPA: 6-hydroxymethylpterin diphosphokinase MptE-like protein [Nitrososphaeraceae archaeon]
MQFIDWFPYYQQIREEFGYSTEKDQNAANLLSKKISKKSMSLKKLQKKIAGKDVLVIGAGPSLVENIAYIKKNRKFVKVVADGAVEALITNNIKPDIVVTDLDGNPAFLKKAEKLGAIMVVHAHGDNENAIENLVPKFKNVVGSTQVMPVDNVYNFGGFTDGDRSAFMADEMGARTIVLVGMDLTEPITKYSAGETVDEDLKGKKLKKAKQLLEMLSKKSKCSLYNKSRKSIKGFSRLDIDDSK